MRWYWSKEKFLKDKDEVIVKRTKNGYSLYKKQRPSLGDLPSKRGKTTFYSSSYSMANSNAYIKKLFDGKKIFDYPKPIELIKDFVRLANTKDNDIVLDFFSGSATLADAVMQLNAEDGGNRRFILVQLPEPTDEKSEAYKAGFKTISEISRERIRRVAKKIKEKYPDFQGDLGFKAFKLDTSNIKAWDADFDTLEKNLLDAVDNIKPDRSEEDLLYEILLKYGLDLSIPIETRDVAGKLAYVVGYGALVVCLDDEITLDSVESIAKLKEEYGSDDLMRVIFKDSSFESSEVKTNAIQILKQHGIDDVKSV